MSNHGFVTTRRRITTAAAGDAINEIVARRFLGKVECKYAATPASDILAFWEFTLTGSKLYPFTVWLRTEHKFEFRHPRDQWSWWAQVCVLTDEIALKFDGTISDEGVGGRWKPTTPTKYPTFLTWVKGSHHYGPHALRRAMAALEYKMAPAEARALDRVILKEKA